MLFGRYKVLYSDRTSSGILAAIDNVTSHDGIFFYEPNSAKFNSLFWKTINRARIVKFSNDRVDKISAEVIRNSCSRTNLIIYTKGSYGLDFTYRYPNGKMSPWVEVPSIFHSSVIDSSGAGDWLSAGIIDELCRWDFTCLDELLICEDFIREVFLSGMRYSQLCCESIGAQGVFYSSSLIEKFKNIRSNFGMRHAFSPLELISNVSFPGACVNCLSN